MSSQVKVTLLGATLGLIANCFHLHSMYIIKVNPIAAGDTLIVRGLVQTLGFGLWSALAALFCKGPSSHNQVQESLLSTIGREWRVWTLAVFCCFAMAVVILLTFITIEMLPLCDFVVFAFTGPIFCMIFSYFILK